MDADLEKRAREIAKRAYAAAHNSHLTNLCADQFEVVVTAARAALSQQPEARGVVDGYYLATFKHTLPSAVMWWGPDNKGYTPDLEQAGVYSELLPDYHDNGYTVPVPVAFIERLRVRRMIDPGDDLNTMFWSAETLRAALTESRNVR